MSWLRNILFEKKFQPSRVLFVLLLGLGVFSASFSNEVTYLKGAPEIVYEKASFEQVAPELLVAENENKDRVRFWDSGAEFITEDDPRISWASSSENFSSEVYYERSANSNDNLYAVRMIVWEKDSISRTPLLYVFKEEITETYNAKWPYYVYDSGWEWKQAEVDNTFFKEHYLKGGLIILVFPLFLAMFWGTATMIVLSFLWREGARDVFKTLLRQKETISA